MSRLSVFEPRRFSFCVIYFSEIAKPDFERFFADSPMPILVLKFDPARARIMNATHEIPSQIATANNPPDVRSNTECKLMPISVNHNLNISGVTDPIGSIATIVCIGAWILTTPKPSLNVALAGDVINLIDFDPHADLLSFCYYFFFGRHHPMPSLYAYFSLEVAPFSPFTGAQHRLKDIAETSCHQTSANSRPPFSIAQPTRPFG